MSSKTKDDSKTGSKDKDNEIKSAENEQKKKAAKRRNVRKRRRASSSETVRDELDVCLAIQQRYGVKKKVQDETKEAIFNPSTGKIFHPRTYERMMARSVEAHLNRMLQAEFPEDLVNSNWLCSFCLKPSLSDSQGELYGPYFVRLSIDCQPPTELLMANCDVKAKPESSKAPHSNKPVKRLSAQKSPATTIVQGSLDVWLHGDCALWAPELFLVGGRLPTLQLHIQRYWKQKCLACGGVGATIPITYSQNGSATPSNNGSTRAQKDFLHFKCASDNGYLLNPLIYVCRPPLSKPIADS